MDYETAVDLDDIATSLERIAAALELVVLLQFQGLGGDVNTLAIHKRITQLSADVSREIARTIERDNART